MRQVGQDDRVEQPVDVAAVLEGPARPSTVLWRGFRKRCPRCGGGDIYSTWFRMRDRCPTCGYLFEREPGFFVGAYLINFAIAEGLLFVLLMGFVFWKSAHPDAGVRMPVVVGVIIGVVAPILFYPFSRTIWSAIDLAMTPLELPEIVAAADAVEAETMAAASPPADHPEASGPPDAPS